MAFRANTKTPEERIALAKRMLAKYPPGTLGHERALETLQRFQTNPKKRKTKRTRTPAQKAATARMLAANKAKRAGAKWKAGKRTPAQRSARKRANTVTGYYPNPGARRSYAVRSLRPGEYFVVRLDQRDGREYGIDAVTPLSWSVAIVTKPPADISFKLPPTLYKNPGFLAWAEKYSARHSLFASLNEIKRQVQAMM